MNERARQEKERGLGVSEMAFIRKMRDEAPDFEKVACVTAICALAGLPLAVCAAVTILG